RGTELAGEHRGIPKLLTFPVRLEGGGEVLVEIRRSQGVPQARISLEGMDDLFPGPSLLRHQANEARRVAAYYGARRDVPGHDGMGPDDRSAADGHPLEDGSTEADPGAVLDPYRFALDVAPVLVRADPAGFDTAFPVVRVVMADGRVQRMRVRVSDGDVPGEHDVVPYLDALVLTADQQATAADRRAGSDGDLADATLEDELPAHMAVVPDQDVGPVLLGDAHVDHDLLDSRVRADLQESPTCVVDARMRLRAERERTQPVDKARGP